MNTIEQSLNQLTKCFMPGSSHFMFHKDLVINRQSQIIVLMVAGLKNMFWNAPLEHKNITVVRKYKSVRNGI